jgi:hypothetical protein
MTTIGYKPPTYQVGNFSSIATTVQTPAPAPAPPKVSLLDRILNTTTKVTNVANQGLTTFQNINRTVNPGSPPPPNPATTYTYEAPGGNSQPGGSKSTGMSTGAKVGIGLGVAALVATLVVVATRGKKKGMAGLGDLNTAKTKSGKVKQRAAVFAKLDAEGKAYPKTKTGVRVKRKVRK